MDLSGRRWGKYQVVERLGQGGMAEVYKAIQPGIERFVALKAMHPHLARTGDFMARFNREAKAIGRLQHNHIVRVIDFDVQDDTPFIVMEYMEGGSLHDYLAQRKLLPSPEALTILAQLADALAYAHRLGMLHRDLKPANVMFTNNSYTNAVLTDFGLVQLAGDAKLTVSGTMLGTPAYMAPEVVRGDGGDARADIFSLGVMLYEMVTGRTPYTGDTPYAIMLKQANDPLPPPRSVNPAVPAAVEQLILTALAKDPAARFQDVPALQAAIRATLTAIGEADAASKVVVGPVPSAAPQRVPATSPPVRRRRWLTLVGAVGGVALMALVTSLVLFRFGGTNQVAGALTAGPTAAPTGQAVATPPSPTPPAITSSPLPTTAPAVIATATPVAEVPSPSFTAVPLAQTPTESVAPTAVAARPAPAGSLRFADNQFVRAGDFVLEVDQVRLPPAGSHYELWVISDDGQTLRNLGKLTVNNSQIALTGSTDENLLRFRRVAISIEPDNDTDRGISAAIVWSGETSTVVAGPVRQLLVADALNDAGLLPAADAQMALAIQHGGLLQEALAAKNFPSARIHAEHVVNILDGKDGNDFGDLDGDGQAQNPGDGVGVRVYLEQADEQVQSLLADNALAEAERSSATGLQTSLKNTLTAVAEAQETALKALAADSVAEMQPTVNDLTVVLQAGVDGTDADDNGVIDPLAQEGALRRAFVDGLALATVALFEPE